MATPVRTVRAATLAAVRMAGAFASAAASREEGGMDPTEPTGRPGDAGAPATPTLIDASHHGAWTGSNRLWITDQAHPFRSEGAVEVSGDALRYRWSHEGTPHTGTLRLTGQPAALRADWTDPWHAADGMTLHGFQRDGLTRLFGTWPAGDGTNWGWQIELDLRDPEAFVLRMFVVPPGHGPVPAVVLDATRS
jgi:hypothetical protein